MILAERFNDFDDLREHIRLKIPDDVLFELPEIDENFVFKYLSTLDTSKATGLYGIGSKLLKLSSGIITKSITYILNAKNRAPPFLSIFFFWIKIDDFKNQCSLVFMLVQKTIVVQN